MYRRPGILGHSDMVKLVHDVRYISSTLLKAFLDLVGTSFRLTESM